MQRIVVLISGNGSNLQALLDACARGEMREAEVSCVISNRARAFGLERAQQAGVPTQVLRLAAYRREGMGGRQAYDLALADLVNAARPDLIVLAGWMHILSPAFLDRMTAPVLNLHPALPGMFPGADGISLAFEAAQRGEIDHTGAMVHHVIPELDAGPVVGTTTVPILPDDTLETLSTRIHAAEHVLLVRCVRDVLNTLDSEEEERG